MFIYLFVLFASEMDDPFNIYSSISVSMESLENLQEAIESWTSSPDVAI